MYGRLDTMKKIFLYFKLISTVNMVSCEKGKEVEVWANFLLTLRIGGKNLGQLICECSMMSSTYFQEHFKNR